MAPLALIVFAAFAVEAMAGFGATVISVTLASHLMPIPEVLARLVPVNVLLSAYLVLRHRRDVAWEVVLRAGLGTMGAGVLLGIALGRLGEPSWLKVAFAAFVVGLSLLELLRMFRSTEQAGTTPLPTPKRTVALLAAGVIHGVFACGGPLLVYVLGREMAEKARFRATLSAIWLLLNGAVLANLLVTGELGAASLRASGVLLASLVAGAAVGEWGHDRMPERRFRITVFGLLLAAGASLLARSLAS
ncbi:MAG: sulfite exporter TauE/SafE family protein [Deltaproteobacteria bacterium]|nr:sulfite exporter TauE/SafE family protein [Deltaproteobacteria bacterium]